MDNFGAREPPCGTVTSMSRMRRPEPWDLDDPGHIISQIDRECPLVVGSIIVALVRRGDGTDRLGGAVEVAPGGGPLLVHEGAALLRDAVSALPPATPIQPGQERDVMVTCVCREGRVIDTRQEWFWMQAWRYANHFSDAMDTEVYAVTPYGWTGILDTRAGLTPTTRRPLSLVG